MKEVISYLLTLWPSFGNSWGLSPAIKARSG